MQYVPQTITQVRELNRDAGHHFFNPDTLRYFRSRISRRVYPAIGCTYFVTSEQFDDTTPRRYTVHVIFPSGNIRSMGEFQDYATREEAHRAAYNYANPPQLSIAN